MNAMGNQSFNTEFSVPLALSISDTCLHLCQATHDAGLYRMAFLLSEIAREAEFALEVHAAANAPSPCAEARPQ
ncbi:MAG: hypothetical protein AcusKO_22250 [Acuticoccus sp.]